MSGKRSMTTILVHSSKDDEASTSTVVVDSTWAQKFGSRYCEVDIRVVAGNREAALNPSLDPASRKPSQLWQKKKYRYVNSYE